LALIDMAGHLIRRLQQISSQVFQQHVQAAGYDLTSVQYAAMYALRENPGAEQARIAALIVYDRATIGGVIDRLERKGYVARSVSEADRRARKVMLTKRGLAVLEEVEPVVVSLQRNILSGLNQQERRQFMTLARKVVTSPR